MCNEDFIRFGSQTLTSYPKFLNDCRPRVEPQYSVQRHWWYIILLHNDAILCIYHNYPDYQGIRYQLSYFWRNVHLGTDDSKVTDKLWDVINNDLSKRKAVL